MRQTMVIMTCDICKEVLDIEKNKAIGILTTTKRMMKLNLGNSNRMPEGTPELHSSEELVNNETDICENCLKKVEDYIDSIKKVEIIKTK